MNNKAIFLDRDDTVIEDPGYINSPEQVKLIEGAAEALVELRKMGYKLVLVSNQSGVARGIVTEKILGEIHERMKYLLVEKGAVLDKIYYCPYHVDGVIEKYRKDSDWRKPNPGMLLAASEELDIELEQSWMVGNSFSDVEAGYRAGCMTILVDNLPVIDRIRQVTVKPDYTAVNIKEAVNIIKQYERLNKNKKKKKKAEIIEEIDESAEIEEIKEAVAELEGEETETLASGKVSTDQAVTDRKEEIIEETKKEQNEMIQTRTSSGEQKRSVGGNEKLDSLSNNSEELLKSILEQLRSMHRTDMFGEFSIMRLLAGVLQVAVVFLVAAAGWYAVKPVPEMEEVMLLLGFSAVLQLMTLSFYIMQGRK